MLSIILIITGGACIATAAIMLTATANHNHRVRAQRAKQIAAARAEMRKQLKGGE